MSELSRRAQGGAPPSGLLSFNVPQSSRTAPEPGSMREIDGARAVSISSRQDAIQQLQELQRLRMGNSNAASNITDGLAALRSKSRSASSSAAQTPMLSPFGVGVEEQSYGLSDASTNDYGFDFGTPSGENRAANDAPNPETLPTADSISPGTVALPSPTNVNLFQEAETFPGLEVYTVGGLMPRSTMDDTNGNYSFDMNTFNFDAGASSSGTSSTANTTLTASPIGTTDTGSKTLRVRRSTYVPGWATTPRVLLVDDDAVTRKLSSKFLQVFGCTIDVAVDGVGAVNKMNLEKYDLVLMVR
jgi:osomolarity two-component system, response regulator SKN7